jgi:hypothetical protein
MLSNDLASDVSSPLDKRKVITPGDLLSGIVVLMDAADATVVGGKVAAFGSIAQADAAKRATYNASDAGFNGQPTATFTGDGPSNHNVYSFSLAGLSACEAFVVLKTAAGADPGSMGLWTSGNPTNVTHYGFNGDKLWEAFGTSIRKNDLQMPSLPTSKHIYNLRSAAGLFAVAFNGVDFYTTATNTVLFTADAAFGYQFVSFPVALSGDVAFVVICDRAQTTDARAAFIAYLKARFGIA